MAGEVLILIDTSKLRPAEKESTPSSAEEGSNEINVELVVLVLAQVAIPVHLEPPI